MDLVIYINHLKHGMAKYTKNILPEMGIKKHDLVNVWMNSLNLIKINRFDMILKNIKTKKR